MKPHVTKLGHGATMAVIPQHRRPHPDPARWAEICRPLARGSRIQVTVSHTTGDVHIQITAER